MADYRSHPDASPSVWCFRTQSLLPRSPRTIPLRTAFGVTKTGIFPAVTCERCALRDECPSSTHSRIGASPFNRLLQKASHTFREAALHVLLQLSKCLEMNTLFVTINDQETNYIVRVYNHEEELVTEGLLPFFESYCSHVCTQEEHVLVIQDTLTDPLTAHMRVTERLGKTTFVGVPIRLHDGRKVGTVCAIDRAPVTLVDRDIRMLQAAAASLADTLEIS